MEMKKNNTFSKKFWIYTALYVLACVSISGLPALLTSRSLIDFTETGQIGDTIGGIMGPVVAMIAAYLTFIAFWVQKQANEVQRQDIKVERFNSNFYNLLAIHEQITDSLECRTNTIVGTDENTEMIKGRSVFQYTYAIRPERFAQGVLYGIKGRMHLWGMDGFMKSKLPSNFDHYFRNMYRIVKYVDETDVFDDLPQDERDKKKYEYVAILRSTLSRYELVWLFYNTLSEYGKEKFKPLVEKYALLNNIRIDLLVKPEDVHQFDVHAFGKAYPAIR